MFLFAHVEDIVAGVGFFGVLGQFLLISFLLAYLRLLSEMVSLFVLT